MLLPTGGTLDADGEAEAAGSWDLGEADTSLWKRQLPSCVRLPALHNTCSLSLSLPIRRGTQSCLPCLIGQLRWTQSSALRSTGDRPKPATRAVASLKVGCGPGPSCSTGLSQGSLEPQGHLLAANYRGQLTQPRSHRLQGFQPAQPGFKPPPPSHPSLKVKLQSG